MNNVNPTDVTLLTLAMGALSGSIATLTQHDYPVAGGLLVIGIVLIYLYHKLGSTTIV